MIEAPIRRTPLHEEHKKAGGRLVPFAGYELPVQYKGLVEEHKAVRTAAGLFDVSHMGELTIEGDDALEHVNQLITNDLARIEDGRALYTCALNEGGTILDDLIVYRKSPKSILVVCNASNRTKIVEHFTAALSGKSKVTDISDDFALLALQGPKALAIAGRSGADGAALSQLKSFGFRDATLFDVAVTASRTGYTGEDGLEILCRPEDASKLWQRLLEAGAEDGIQPAGLGARDTLRLEARLSLYGNDIDETTNPLEAGLGWAVKLDKSDFLGKASLVAIQAQGLSRKIVGIEMIGRGIARHGYAFLDAAGKEVGTCTSGSPGPTVQKNIGLGYLPTSMTAIGTTLTVDCRGRHAEAVVVKTPFYKRSQ